MSGVQEIRGQKAEKNPSRQKSKATITSHIGNLIKTLNRVIHCILNTTLYSYMHEIHCMHWSRISIWRDFTNGRSPCVQYSSMYWLSICIQKTAWERGEWDTILETSSTNFNFNFTVCTLTYEHWWSRPWRTFSYSTTNHMARAKNASKEEN